MEAWKWMKSPISPGNFGRRSNPTQLEDALDTYHPEASFLVRVLMRAFCVSITWDGLSVAAKSGTSVAVDLGLSVGA